MRRRESTEADGALRSAGRECEARPQSSRRVVSVLRRLTAVVPGFAVVLLLAGCLDATATIELQEDGSGRFELEYRLSTDVYEMGVFDRDSPFVAVPIHRDDLRRAAEGVDGVEMRDYTLRRSDGEVLIRTSVSFDSLDALNAYYSPGEERIRLGESNGRQRLLVDLHPGDVGELDAETRSFADAYLSEYTVELRVRPPSNVGAAEAMEIVENGRSATAGVTLAELFTGRAPQTVSVEW
ncbi:MAG: hypothetical protein ACOCYG_02440 [Spirochaetota bacterium]